MKQKGNGRFTWILLCAFVALGTAASVFSGCQQPTASDLNAVTGASNASTATTALSLTPSAAGPPDVISAVSGNAQTAVNGSQLSNQLTVRVTDVSGKPVPNVSVTFAPGIGGGLIATQATVVTDSSGFAAATVILGSTVGTQTFTATMPSGSIPSVTFTHSATAVSSLLKIFALAGTNPIGTTGLVIGDSFSLRTVLVSSTGAFIKEIPATWWMTGTLAVGNLAITGGNPSKYATFTPTVLGVGTINAIVDDATLISQNNITSTTTVTGTITVSLALTPDTLSIESGNLQTAQVGTNLAQNLVVKVVNAGNTPVPGANVTFAVASGGGQIVSAQPVATDASGLAACVVKLGGVVGGGHSFTATMATGTMKQVLFTATGTHAAAAQLSFYQQPGGANSGSPFVTQPVVEIQDQYGNRVTADSTSTVTLSVNTGIGSLSGTLTATFSSGLATFTNAAYSVGEAGVKLTAASSIGGVSSGISGAFTVGTIIAAAQCAAEGNGWQTIDGGCKDLTSGLVWSAHSSAVGVANMSWHNAVWDSATSGSPSPEAWQVARGITKDVSGTTVIADAGAGAYCQNLVESGFTDWRMPSISNFTAADIHGAYTALKNSASAAWGSGDGVDPTRVFYYIAFTAGNAGGNYAYNGPTAVGPVRCVREPAPTKLIVTRQVDGTTFGLGVNVAWAQQPIVRISDSTNSTVTWSTVPVTLTVTGGTGQLCTTTTTTGVTSGCAAFQTVNAAGGSATFSSLSYSKAETVTLTASSPGLTSTALAPFTVNQTYPKALCRSVGGAWINGLGGCKDTTTGLILGTNSGFGYPSSFTMTWYDFVWDQLTVGGNSGTQETSDDGRTNDYDPVYPRSHTYPDNSTVNYCHSLKESGQTDWLALIYDMNPSVMYNAGKAPGTYLNWNSSGTAVGNVLTSLDDTGANAYANNAPTGNGGYYSKGSQFNVACVRRDPPANLRFTQQIAATVASPYNAAPYGSGGNGYTNGFGAGVKWTSQPIIDVIDADGAGPLALDASTVTVEVAPASDSTGGTGRLLCYQDANCLGGGLANEDNKLKWAGTSKTLVTTRGRVTVSGMAYETPGEKFRLKITATGIWEGQTYNIGPLYSSDITVPQTFYLSECSGNSNTNFATDKGGCRDVNAGGLVWAEAPHTLNTALNWYQMIWDSLVGDPAKSGESATNEYDAAYPPGTSIDSEPYDVCHRLVLNGYYDWRLPTYSEVDAQISFAGHRGFNTIKYKPSSFASEWMPTSSSSTTVANVKSFLCINPANCTYGGSWNAGTWYQSAYAKTNTNTNLHYFCVRSPNASSAYTY